MKAWVAVLIVLGAGLVWQPFEGASVDAQPVMENDAGPEATQLPDAPERIVEELQKVRVVMERQQATLEQIQVQLSEQKKVLEAIGAQQQETLAERERIEKSKSEQATVVERSRSALQQAHEEIVLGNFAAQSTLRLAEALLLDVPGGSAIEGRDFVQKALEALDRRDFLAARQYTEWAQSAIRVTPNSQ